MVREFELHFPERSAPAGLNGSTRNAQGTWTTLPRNLRVTRPRAYVLVEQLNYTSGSG